MSFSRDLDFQGRRVLVTGAANGFGAAMARLFACQNARLVLADIEAENVQALALELGGDAHAFDQADAASIERLAAAVGAVDVLVNNAGILIPKSLLEMEPDEIRRLIDTDFVGVALMMRAFGRGMVERKRGVILNFSSQTAFAGGENRGIYAAAKAAVSQLTRSAAVEWGPHGVRVLALAPGRCLTRMTVQTAAPGYAGDRGLARVPLGRWGTPDEIAKIAVMLCSDVAAYMTGETVIADGGYVIGRVPTVLSPRCGTRAAPRAAESQNGSPAWRAKPRYSRGAANRAKKASNGAPRIRPECRRSKNLRRPRMADGRGGHPRSSVASGCLAPQLQP